MEINKIHQGDALKLLKEIPDGSVDLVLTDPPYNVGKEKEWDIIRNYQDWWIAIVRECERCLKPTGVFYFFHNDMKQIANMIVRMENETSFLLNSFCVWDKGESYRTNTIKITRPEARHSVRSWFNSCEYVLEFWKGKDSKDGLQTLKSNPELFKSIKEYYKSELNRLGLTHNDVKEYYCKVTGKGGAMFRHYFQDSQFEIPTKEIWEQVFVPLGFRWRHDELEDNYRGLLSEYEGLREEYEKLRHYHVQDDMHRNVFTYPTLSSNNRLHSCQKPLPLLRRLLKTSSREGELVLDPFMGSGSTAVACIQEGRQFVGFEQNPEYFKTATRRVENEAKQLTWRF